MHTFEIAESERFPALIDGLIVPDDGRRLRFSREAENYYGSEQPLIGLFVSEYGTSLEIPALCENELMRMGAIVTFGAHVLKEKVTHLDIIAQELKLPYMRLIIPVSYPKIHNTLNEQDPFYVQWVDNNPLKEIYHRHIRLEHADSVATFSLV